MTFLDRHSLRLLWIGILSVFLNCAMEEVYDTALASQNAWKNGNQSGFEIVE